MLDLLSKGDRNQIIASKLGMSKTSVDTALWRLRKKFYARTNTELVINCGKYLPRYQEAAFNIDFYVFSKKFLEGVNNQITITITDNKTGKKLKATNDEDISKIEALIQHVYFITSQEVSDN